MCLVISEILTDSVRYHTDKYMAMSSVLKGQCLFLLLEKKPGLDGGYFN